MPENLLTDAKVRSAKSTDRDWKLSDGGGLFLLVKPTGGKLWRWKYRLQGKENGYRPDAIERQLASLEARTLAVCLRCIEEMG
jgi:hypothetical protein